MARALAPAAFVVLVRVFVSPLQASAPPENPGARAFDEKTDGSPSVVSYLYVEANEDGAAGGHVALRIGEAVYHYQRLPDGLFVLDRTPLAGFLFSYSRLQNRNIHELPLSVDGDKRERLLERLNDRFIAHRRLVQRLESVRNRRRMLGEIRAGRSAALLIPAAGYFLPLPSRAISEESAFSISVRKRLAFQEQDRAVDGLTSQDSLESFQEAHLAGLLRGGFIASPGAFASGGVDLGGAFEGHTHEIRLVCEAWQRRMSELLASSREERPDRARAVLEMLASLYSLNETMRGGNLIVPLMAGLDDGGRAEIARDAIAYSTRPSPSSPLSADPGVERFRRSLHQRIEAFLAGVGSRVQVERNCNDECAAEVLFLWNRVLEGGARLALAERYGTVNAFDHGYLLTTPSYGRRVFLDRGSGADRGNDVDAEWDQVTIEERSLLDRATNELNYSLLRKNCATELLREMDEALGLGLQHTLSEGLFFPWMSMVQLRKRFPASREVVHLSYRNELLEAASGTGEISTVTSRHYHFNGRDSTFLFFTEDADWARPVFGLVNLVPTTAQTLAGLLVIPFRGPSMFARGIRGMAFSVTEVVGISIRKGTFRSTLPTFYEFPAVRSAENGVMNPGSAAVFP